MPAPVVGLLFRIHSAAVLRRWTIRQYDSVLNRWTDSGQTFWNKRDAELRLKGFLIEPVTAQGFADEASTWIIVKMSANRSRKVTAS
jgi:hypothetical protein